MHANAITAARTRRLARPRRADVARMAARTSKRTREALAHLVDECGGDVCGVFVDTYIQIITKNPKTRRLHCERRRLSDHLSHN